MSKRLNTKGFSAVETLLILVIVAILGFTGWFVWHAKHNVDTSLNNTGKSTNSVTKKAVTPATKDETARWLIYEPPGKEYTVRLADGWKLERYQLTSDLSTFLNTDLSPVPGTKAIVTEVQGGKDGRTGFFLNYATKNIEQIVTPGAKQTSLKTKDGLEIEKYYLVQTSDGLLGPGPQKGDTQYTYVIRKSSNRVVVTNYSFQPTHTDYHELVEKVLQTVHFN